ncbi:HD domain-containing protein [Candidatus Saccharibacteria bacterium]|nr:HD domain-containing protein [Candidatus Saccharibacteria bacterium]
MSTLPTIEELLSSSAREICEFYAKTFRMSGPRAICSRYSYPGAKHTPQLLVQMLSGHSYNISQLVIAIYMEFRRLFRIKDLCPKDLSFLGVNHDNPEAISGDSATGVDGITKELKESVEAGAILRLYGNLACRDFMIAEFKRYEARDEYPTQIVKMTDSIELILFSQLCVRNGVGMIKQTSDGFVLITDEKDRLVDPRTHAEISDYFKENGLVLLEDTLFKDNSGNLPISRIMYDHSLSRLENQFGERAPELIEIFKLISKEAATFPFENFNFKNMPAMFL